MKERKADMEELAEAFNNGWQAGRHDLVRDLLYVLNNSGDLRTAQLIRDWLDEDPK